MKSKIFITLLIIFIIAVNALTVFWLVRDKEKTAPTSQDALQKIFAEPTEIAVVRDGEKTVLSEDKYKQVLSLLENSHRYIESFDNISSFSGTDKLSLELNYDKTHTFKYGGFEYTASSIKINLYNGAGDMLLQTEDGSVALGYLNITAELIESVR